MSVLKRSAGLLGLVIVSATPAPAGSAVTERFLANLVPNVDFLDRSSRFALTNSKDARLKAFAFGEARDATLVANDLYDWSQASGMTAMASIGGEAWQGHAPAPELDKTPTGSTPIAAAQQPAPSATPALPPDDRLARGQEDLDSLEGLEGPAFDSEYKDKQKDALGQVETDYADYLKDGDDPKLLEIARRELSKIRKQIAALGKL